MGVGPILIFDKSTLQSLSIDGSVWLDAFYLPNITPLFFVEPRTRETMPGLAPGVPLHPPWHSFSHSGMPAQSAKPNNT